MPVFPSKKFQTAADLNSPGARYRSAISKRPFLLFGLPFLTSIVAGSFILTPATAIRYEKHDRKVKQLTREQELDVRKNPRKVDWRDEYQVGSPSLPPGPLFARAFGRGLLENVRADLADEGASG